MSKESLIGIENKLIFRETFNSEFDARKNGGIPHNVEFKNGVGVFDKSKTSYINYGQMNNLLYSSHTVRLNIKFTEPDRNDNQYYIGVYNAKDAQRSWGFSLDSGTNNLVIRTSSDGQRISTFSSISIEDKFNEWLELTLVIYDTGAADMYIDGVLSTSFSTSFAQNLFKSNANFYIGSLDDGENPCSCEMNLVEIYNTALTSEEVALLYNNKTYKKPSIPDKILDFDSSSGVLKCNRAITVNNVDIVKTGNYYGVKFNGVDSYIETDLTDPSNWNTGHTILGWINVKGVGGLGYGIIFGTGAKGGINAFINGVRIGYKINDITSASTSNLTYFNWTFFAITVSSDEKLNMYFADLNTSPYQANNKDTSYEYLDTINITDPFMIGGINRNIFDGDIKMLQVYKEALDFETITQIWSESKHKVI